MEQGREDLIVAAASTSFNKHYKYITNKIGTLQPERVCGPPHLLMIHGLMVLLPCTNKIGLNSFAFRKQSAKITK
jgi:hypothetical protein